MREVHGPQMFINKEAYPKENLRIQFKKRGSPQWMILMKEEKKTLLREIENPHKLPISSKRKRGTNKEGESEYLPRNEIVPEDMELDVNIEKIEFTGEEQRLE
jgi:hypothetical protein